MAEAVQNIGGSVVGGTADTLQTLVQPVAAVPGKAVQLVTSPGQFWFWLTQTNSGKSTLFGSFAFFATMGTLYYTSSGKSCAADSGKKIHWKRVAMSSVVGILAGSLFYCHKGGF